MKTDDVWEPIFCSFEVDFCAQYFQTGLNQPKINILLVVLELNILIG